METMTWGEMMAFSLLHRSGGMTVTAEVGPERMAGDRIVALAECIESERMKMKLDSPIQLITSKRKGS